MCVQILIFDDFLCECDERFFVSLININPDCVTLETNTSQGTVDIIDDNSEIILCLNNINCHCSESDALFLCIILFQVYRVMYLRMEGVRQHGSVSPFVSVPLVGGVESVKGIWSEILPILRESALVNERTSNTLCDGIFHCFIFVSQLIALSLFRVSLKYLKTVFLSISLLIPWLTLTQPGVRYRDKKMSIVS